MRPELLRFLEREGVQPNSLVTLAGDASARRYHRARSMEGHAVVVMEGDEAFPEEDGPGAERFAFAYWQRFYDSLGLRVPAIHALDRPAGLALIEDLGDELLQDRVERLGPEACRSLYLEAVRIGRRLAEEGTSLFSPDDTAADDTPADGTIANRPAPDRAAPDDPLTPARLAWEMDFFLRHSLGLEEDDLACAEGAIGEARELLHALCEDLHQPAGGEMVLCHRDYHARNLMVLDGRDDDRGDGSAGSADHAAMLAVIDFQDTRRGPRAYDLASLAWDPYVDLPRALIDELVAAWRPASVDAGDWQQEVALAAGQRLIKAAGSYAWLAHGLGRKQYLQWYRPALQRAEDCLSSWPRRKALLRALRAAEIT